MTQSPTNLTSNTTENALPQTSLLVRGCMRFYGFLKKTLKWGILSLLVITLLIAIGFHQFGNTILQQKNIQQKLKSQIATAFKTNENNVAWQDFQLKWNGLAPHLHLQNFAINNNQKEPLISFRKAEIDLGRLDLGIEEAIVDELHLHIYNRVKGLEIAGFISDNSPTPPWFKWINKNQLNDAMVQLHLKPLRNVKNSSSETTANNFNISFDSLLDFSNKESPVNINIKAINWLENTKLIHLEKPITITAQPNFQNHSDLGKNVELNIDSLGLGQTNMTEKISFSQLKNNQSLNFDVQLNNFWKQKSVHVAGLFEAEKSWANATLNQFNIHNQQGKSQLKKGNCSMQHCFINGLELGTLNDLLLQTSQNLYDVYPLIKNQLTTYLPHPLFEKFQKLQQTESLTKFEKQREQLKTVLAQWQQIKHVSGTIDDIQWHQESTEKKDNIQGLKLKISGLSANFQQYTLPKTNFAMNSVISQFQKITSDVTLKNHVLDVPKLKIITTLKEQKIDTAAAQFSKGMIDFTALQGIIPELKNKFNVQGVLQNITGDFNHKNNNVKNPENHWNIKGQGKNIIIKLNDKTPLLTGNPSLEIKDKSVKIVANPLVLKTDLSNTLATLSSVQLNLSPELFVIQVAPSTLEWNNESEFNDFSQQLQRYIPNNSTNSNNFSVLEKLKSLNVLGKYTISGQLQKPTKGTPFYQANLLINNGSIGIPSYPHLMNLQGGIHLKHAPKQRQINQIHVDNLTTTIAGQDIKINGFPNNLSNKESLMTITGAMNIDELLQKYPNFQPLKPLGLVANGIIDFESTINPQKIDFYSTLKNAQINLPQPLQKIEKDVQAPFYLSYNRINPALLIEWRDRFFSSLELKSEQVNQPNLLKQGTLILGGDSQQKTAFLPDHSGLNVFAELDYLNLDEWKTFLTKLKNLKNNENIEKIETVEPIEPILTVEEQEKQEKLLNSWLPKKMNLAVKELQFDERKLHQVKLNIASEDSVTIADQTDTIWNMNISSDEINGQANWHQGHRLSSRADKVFAHFSTMTIPQKDLSLLKTLLGYEADKKTESVEKSTKVTKPSEGIQIPEIDLTIDSLKYHEQELGKAVLKTEIDPLSPEYVLLDELSINGDILKAKIAGYFPNQLKNSQKKNMTSSSSLKEKENVGLQWELNVPKLELLSTLIPSEIANKQPQLKTLFNSGTLNTKGSMGWQGQLFTEPKIIAKTIEGTINLDAQKVRVIPLDLGWGKGLSLFNPKTWARFTVLNFSDLMDKGYLIDEAKLSGKFAKQQFEMVGNNFVDSNLAKVKGAGFINFNESESNKPNESTKPSTLTFNPNITLTIEPKIVTGISATVLSFVVNPLIGLGLVGTDYVADFPIQEWLSFDYVIKPNW